MENESAKALCLALLKADTAQEVIDLLTKASYWNNPVVWHNYGDYENNYNTIGNQQSRPDAALVEKCVNSVDARLMNECLVRHIDPESSQAPGTLRDAVAFFFDYGRSSGLAGRISNWSNAKRTEVARGITVAATGSPPREGSPSFTISDNGEGQTPEAMPDTFLSLTKSNKLRIPFVQGKFNMGGTGVLKFCKGGLQLILTRRNPAILNGTLRHPSDTEWGLTVVRREEPQTGRLSSVYTYLAPVGSKGAPRRGVVLRFSGEAMPIFPEGRNAYARDSAWGTLIKLYEYSATGYSNTHILRKDGLLGRLDLLLTDPALPIRLHECRPAFRGHEGSFETTLTGLSVRLEDDKGENLEEGFPCSCPMSVDGQQMIATIYAFKRLRAETYRRNEGVIFTVNGQTHGHLTKDFFNRKNAGRLNYIADSILVVVDCSEISIKAREDLFKNSRDRLSGEDIRWVVEEELEEMLKHHEALRALKERRRSEEIQSKLQDEKPLEDILRSLLEHSPTLSALFLRGRRATNPFKTIRVRDQDAAFEGKRHPTYFKFRDKEYGEVLTRECPVNRRCRVAFETDAANDYFSRALDKGEFSLSLLAWEVRAQVSGYVGPNLQNGIASLTVQLPAGSRVGDHLTFEAVVSDPAVVQPFINRFSVDVKPEAEQGQRQEGSRSKPPGSQVGDKREIPAGIVLPNINRVYERDWTAHTPQFDRYTALRVKTSDVASGNDSEEDGGTQDIYDFYINMDNLFLKSELKGAGDEVELSRKRWEYGLILVGLALLHDDAQRKKTGAQSQECDEEREGDESIEDLIERISGAMAPVLLPMIASLGALELENVITGTASGEAT